MHSITIRPDDGPRAICTCGWEGVERNRPGIDHDAQYEALNHLAETRGAA